MERIGNCFPETFFSEREQIGQRIERDIALVHAHGVLVQGQQRQHAILMLPAAAVYLQPCIATDILQLAAPRLQLLAGIGKQRHADVQVVERLALHLNPMALSADLGQRLIVRG